MLNEHEELNVYLRNNAGVRVVQVMDAMYDAESELAGLLGHIQNYHYAILTLNRFSPPGGDCRSELGDVSYQRSSDDWARVPPLILLLPQGAALLHPIGLAPNTNHL
jgi:hypothetical protein